MANKHSDDDRTDEVMDALKEVLDAYSRSHHNVSYSMTESEGNKARVISITVRVPTR